jgi:hypothetical protein
MSVPIYVEIAMSKNPDKNSPCPYLPRVRKTIYFEPDYLNWLDEKIRQRKWASYSHAVNFFIAYFQKQMKGRDFKIVW